MSIRRERYPSDWNVISQRIRERAGNRCEQCGAVHGEIIFRYISDPAKFLALNDPHFDEILYWNADDIREKGVKVILTVHHIGIAHDDGTPGSPEDKQDCRDANLTALCQRCHLAADKPDSIKKAVRTKLAKKHAAKQAAGQMALFEVVKS